MTTTDLKSSPPAAEWLTGWPAQAPPANKAGARKKKQ